MKPPLRPVILGCALLAPAAWACSLPVFRYALERWPETPFRLAVLQGAETARPAQVPGPKLHPIESNSLEFETHGIERLPEGIITQQWREDLRPELLPLGLLLTPEEYGGEPRCLWRGCFDSQGLADLRAQFHSPLLLEVCRALAAGESAVWIVAQGGEEQENRRVYAELEATLASVSKELKLPHEADFSDAAYRHEPSPGVPLRLSFRILAANLRDPRNAVLRRTLAALDPRAQPDTELIVIPVYGRCRALALLRGEELRSEVFRAVAEFLIGPCACQVKALHPGFDLLAPFPWDEVLAGGAAREEALAELATLTARTAGATASTTAGKAIRHPSREFGGVWRWGLGGALAAVVAFLIIFRRRRSP
jgi:hypothetical protein